MEKEQYNNLLHRIKKSYSQFGLVGKDSKKENKSLIFIDGSKNKIIGWSHRNENNIVFGFIEDKTLYGTGEVDFRNLREIFEKVEELINL